MESPVRATTAASFIVTSRSMSVYSAYDFTYKEFKLYTISFGNIAVYYVNRITHKSQQHFVLKYNPALVLYLLL